MAIHAACDLVPFRPRDYSPWAKDSQGYPMQLASAYRATLWIPLVPAVPVVLLAALAGDRLGPIGPIAGNAALAYVGGSVWIGVPYLIFAALAIGWSWEASIKQLRIALNIAPLLFTTLLVGVWALLAVTLDGPMDWRWFRDVTWQVVLYVLVYGYVCVGLAHAALRVLRRRGYLEAAA